MRDNVLYVVCPCYNEEQTLKDSAEQLLMKIKLLINKNLIDKTSKLILIDDGSKDNTWEIIETIVGTNKNCGGIKLSRNFGQYAALMAGYLYAKEKADISISLDVDLQDDISIMDEMLEKYHQGADVVLAIRSSRKSDSFLKKSTAFLYYKLMKICGSNMIPEHPDYRLLSKKALIALSLFKDKKPYLRGIIPKLGFKTEMVKFERKNRKAGETSYNYLKLIEIAVSGIVKTSSRLLLFPLLCAFIAFIGLFIHISAQIYWLLGFLSLFVIGLYIADIKEQAYQEPSYIIDKII